MVITGRCIETGVEIYEMPFLRRDNFQNCFFELIFRGEIFVVL
jgi:hypothetical protein